MFFYENTPAVQESYNCYATNATSAGTKISYHFSFYSIETVTDLHIKIDRVLELLESEQLVLAGNMSTQEATDFLAISKRTFERKVQQGLISPISKDRKKNRFSKQAVMQFYMTYWGHKPTHMP